MEILSEATEVANTIALYYRKIKKSLPCSISFKIINKRLTQFLYTKFFQGQKNSLDSNNSTLLAKCIFGMKIL